MIRIFYLPFIIIASLPILSCHPRNKSVSFYYWKTTFHLNDYEIQVLKSNNVKTLYLRYFDVDFLPRAVEPEPVSPLRGDFPTEPYRIVPVIYIKNTVFERIDSIGVQKMVENIFSLVSQISNTHTIRASEIQFDCDWTEKTKKIYFLFIRQYRIVSKQIISATIRLHQVKYPQITGIPPVDIGVLMYYNMGEINSGITNSIYEKSIADRYNSYISTYPLTLDIALPIFLWSLQIRNGRVIQLLNKMNFAHFENDSNFISVKKNWFSAKHACFKGGYYFKENDMIKIENVSTENLQDMTVQLNRHSNHQIRNVIFYDLDSINLIQYDKDIFKKILHRID